MKVARLMRSKLTITWRAAGVIVGDEIYTLHNGVDFHLQYLCTFQLKEANPTKWIQHVTLFLQLPLTNKFSIEACHYCCHARINSNDILNILRLA